MSKWEWVLSQFSKKLWLRASLFCIAAVITALIAYIFKGFIPEDVSRKVGAEAVDGILQIIASSMLAVTIFSLSTMVSAYSAASTNITPRATKLLLEDNVAQNALSTFIGSFLFSLVGIVALTIGIYGDSGRLILFAVTIGVILLIVTVLLRWINYLSQLGRVGNVIDMVEDAARNAMVERLNSPYFGGTKLMKYEAEESHHAILHAKIGYVQHIDIRAISLIAQKYNLDIFIHALPGKFNDGHHPILTLSSPLEENICTAIRKAYSIGDSRSYEQDPRFGMIVLSEIASRALSPAVNDPGTAIDVIGTAWRLLAYWVTFEREEKDEVLYPRVFVPPITTAQLFNDIFTPIARDGASILEVGMRLQKALKSLHSMGDKEAKEATKIHSALALSRAKAAMNLKEDKDVLTALAL